MTRHVALAAVALVLAGAAPALGADFTPVPLPPGASADDPTSLQGFASSGDTWMGIASGNVYLTSDEALTWRRVTLSGQPTSLISVAPDGAFWLPLENGAGRLSSLGRVAADGSVTYTPIPQGISSPPAWDLQGRMWVAGISGGTKAPVLNVVRMDPSGNEAERITTPADDTGFAYIRFVGGDGYVGTDVEVFRLAAGKLTRLSGTASSNSEFLSKDMWPELSLGKFLFTFRGLSRDGGGRFVWTARPQFGVYGNPDLLVRYPFVGQSEASVMRKCAPTLFCESGLSVPAGTGAIWQTKAGLIAATLDPNAPTGVVPGKGPPLSIHRGALPPPPATGGAVPKGSRALWARLNAYRKAAGLRPLEFDPAISRAAFNHARYAVQHHVNLAGSNPHAETKGAAGFTGADPAARCQAEGGRCDGEDMVGGDRPIDTLISSFYHRLIAESPFTEIGGVATYKGVTVLDFDTKRAAIPLTPAGFPSGVYRGPLGLRGKEVPDPLDICKPIGFSVPKHPGVPVIFEPPGREPSRPKNLSIEIREGPDITIKSVALFTRGKRVPGCGEGLGAFMAYKPLRPHTRYTAKAVWRPSPRSPFETYTWSFRTR